MTTDPDLLRRRVSDALTIYEDKEIERLFNSCMHRPDEKALAYMREAHEELALFRSEVEALIELALRVRELVEEVDGR